MTSLLGQAASSGEDNLADEIPDDFFATLPDLDGPAPVAEPMVPTIPNIVAAPVLEVSQAAIDDEAELFATLPVLPSINGFATRLNEIQSAIEEAKAEAAALRAEIQQKASALRALAGALEATI